MKSWKINNMIDYQIAHNLKELRNFSSKGYSFLAVLDPNSWLMTKEVAEEVEETPIKIKEEITKDNGLELNQENIK